MTPDQRLLELRKELLLHDRLASLLVEVARDQADAELRVMYKTLDPAAMMRQTGIAEGIEKLAREITKAPKPAPTDQSRSPR